MLFRSPRGTKDILPPESSLFQELEAKARQVFGVYGFEEVRTPILEESKLFSRSLGDLTDIVQKQMFLIKKETETFVLRPEATASIIRAYVENTLYNVNAVTRFYYMGPMFRAERPQKGRLRQFHQFGAEAIGSYHPYVDAEMVRLAAGVLEALGVTGFEVQVNTLGCLNDKKDFTLALRETLLPLRKSFCEDCQSRIAKNVLRVLDCKNRPCGELIAAQNLGTGHICAECKDHFERFKDGLGRLGVPYKVDPFLVRGLDYYTRTVFEITHAGLGSQDAIGAGGRYDNLVKELGGPDRGAVGFALGLERVILARPAPELTATAPSAVDVYLIPLGLAATQRCLEVAAGLRAAGLRTEIDLLEGSLKASLRRCDSRGAKTCIIIGDNELAKNAYLIKDMKAGTQAEVPSDGLVQHIKGVTC